MAYFHELLLELDKSLLISRLLKFKEKTHTSYYLGGGGSSLYFRKANRRGAERWDG